MLLGLLTKRGRDEVPSSLGLPYTPVPQTFIPLSRRVIIVVVFAYNITTASGCVCSVIY